MSSSCKLKGASYITHDGNKYSHVGGICFYTNLDVRRDNTFITSTGNKYYGNESKYPTYDNYNAINVDRIADIPDDYYGVMGVPITFLGSYCSEQFDILGTATGRNEFDELAWPIKRYENPIQHNQDGTTTNGSKVNTTSVIIIKDIPVNGTYYTADNADGMLKSKYRRIFIRRKRS